MLTKLLHKGKLGPFRAIFSSWIEETLPDAVSETNWAMSDAIIATFSVLGVYKQRKQQQKVMQCCTILMTRGADRLQSRRGPACRKEYGTV
jgi:hypothetical protein